MRVVSSGTHGTHIAPVARDSSVFPPLSRIHRSCSRPCIRTSLRNVRSARPRTARSVRSGGLGRWRTPRRLLAGVACGTARRRKVGAGRGSACTPARTGPTLLPDGPRGGTSGSAMPARSDPAIERRGPPYLYRRPWSAPAAAWLGRTCRGSGPRRRPTNTHDERRDGDPEPPTTWPTIFVHEQSGAKLTPQSPPPRRSPSIPRRSATRKAQLDVERPDAARQLSRRT